MVLGKDKFTTALVASTIPTNAPYLYYIITKIIKRYYFRRALNPFSSHQVCLRATETDGKWLDRQLSKSLFTLVSAYYIFSHLQSTLMITQDSLLGAMYKPSRYCESKGGAGQRSLPLGNQSILRVATAHPSPPQWLAVIFRGDH